MSKTMHIFSMLLALGSAASIAFAQEAEVQPSGSAEAIPATEASRPFQLGATVTDSPGLGVLVKGVLWGGPADRSGIQSGDFIMAVDGHEVMQPDDLQERVQSASVAKKLDVTVWRRGQTIVKTVAFDPRFSESTREKAWLGVMLKMTTGGEVVIADVMPASPAAEGGIRVGDTVLRINAEKIDSAEELMNLMSRIKAGDNVEVTVLRNGQESTFTVRVGSAIQRTMRWFEDHVPIDRLERRWKESIPEIDVDGHFESFEGMIDRLRQEMNDLREEVQRLRKTDAENGNDELDANDELDGNDSDKDSKAVSTIDTRIVPVALANEASALRPRSYRNYRGGRPQVQYRYGYRNDRRPAFRSPRYFYYSPPVYGYPRWVYPRTPNMMYYGPRFTVFVGPGVYWY